MKCCRNYPRNPAVENGVPGVIQLVRTYIADLQSMISDDADRASVQPTGLAHLLVKKLQDHMREWDTNWEKVLTDAEEATKQDNLIRFDAGVMNDWKIIQSHFKSAVWSNHCPHRKRHNQCKDCGGT